MKNLSATTSLHIQSTWFFTLGMDVFFKAHLPYIEWQWLSISEHRWPEPLSPSAARRNAAAALVLSPSAAPRLPAEPESNTHAHTMSSGSILQRQTNSQKINDVTRGGGYLLSSGYRHVLLFLQLTEGLQLCGRLLHLVDTMKPDQYQTVESLQIQIFFFFYLKKHTIKCK